MDAGNMNTAPGKVLLSGASGMLGAALRTALQPRNAPVSQQVLQLVRRPPVSSDELQWNPASDKPIAATEPLEGLNAAIHLSGANVAARRWTPAYRREVAASRVDSTHALATMLAGLHRPPQALLVASATGIYGDRGDELLDESSPPGSGFLADVCRAWEAAAQPALEAGIRVVHLRFGVVIGPGAGALAKMLPAFRMGLGGRLGSGRQWMSWIGLADLVAAVLFAQARATLAGPLNLVSPNPVTNAQFTRALAHRLHRPAIMPVPAFALRLAMGQMADEALLASARVVPGKLLEAGFRFTQPTVEEALAAALQ
jgi:uncharacterized protein (TIGR01777 family)